MRGRMPGKQQAAVDGITVDKLRVPVDREH
jgi:hypothetical protein